MVGFARAEDAKPFFFIQLTDPQFGMSANNANFEQETANFEFAIATANRLKPAFVIVTGDLTNRTADPAQTSAYLRIAAKLDRSIRLYNVPGNHDVRNEPTPETIAAYTARFGPDHYTFRQGSMLGVVLNSSLIQSPKTAPREAEQQADWLRAELEKAKRDGVGQIVIFQHHPWFLSNIDEPNGYENLPRDERRQYLKLFQDYGVRHVFTGHLHCNQIVRSGSVEMVATAAIGQPLRDSGSGLRIVIVRDGQLEHRFYGMGEIPNRIDISPKTEAKPAKAAVGG